MDYWPSTKQRQPIIQREFRGVNTLDPFSIAPEFATEVKNLTSTKYPAASTRPGYSLLGSTFSAKITGLGAWKDQELHAVGNGEWKKWTGSAWSSLATGLNSANDTSFCNFQGNLPQISLIMANGVDPIKYYDGATVSNLATAPTGGKYIEQFADRLWCVVGNELKASAYRMANDWTTVNGDDADSWYGVIETPNGEQISAIRSGLTKLIIGKPNSLHELFGYSPSDYSVRTVTMEMGPINNKSMAALKGTMYILHTTGLYRYSGGSLPDKTFSSAIQGYIDRMNATAKGTSAVSTDGEKVYVSIPINSSTAPDTILVYDPKYGTWYVWEDISAPHFARLGSSYYLGDILGRVVLFGGSTDAGIAINYEWVSKPFTASSMGQVLRWIRAWITANVPSGSTMDVYLSKSSDGDDWVNVKSITAETAISSSPIYIQTNVAANARMIRIKISGTGPVDLYEFSREQDSLPLR